MQPARLSVSVAMCTYNGQRFLREQLDSIALQTLLPDELIICDDGSEDATPEIVQDFAHSVPFLVKFARNPQNLGSTKNFERAISLCTGDLIALCDQDDIWLPNKLQRQGELLKRNPTLGGVFSDATIVDDRSTPTSATLWGTFAFTRNRQRIFRDKGGAAQVMIRGNVVTGATLMVRSTLRPLFLPVPSSCVHDSWIAWMLLLSSMLAFIEEPLVKYRVHAGQQIGFGSIVPSRELSFVQRLRKGKDEEGSLYLACAREVRALQAKIIEIDDPTARNIVPLLQDRVRFSEGRGRLFSSSLNPLGFVFRNLNNYRRFERMGWWKCVIRDLLMAFV